ncbi:MAG: hypothetical protein M3Q23_07895 [Actinomycetota bacterium]|nr:hypothetical protein [Actinomycetota bacterium]
MSRPRTLALIGALSAVALLSPARTALGAGAQTLAGRAASLGLTCSPVTSGDGVTYTRCTGEIPTFDGIGLDTDLSIPAGATAPAPTVVFLHGWSLDKTNWEASSTTGDSAEQWHWNNVWFASRGWVAVNYTARGFEESCGMADSDPNCPNGYTHLADRNFETRDTQTILGKLVDAGIANAGRLLSTGESYGGGQSWLLATALPWKSPRGRSLQLAAAVPLYGWTDLLDSLAPSGRATDHTSQTADHVTPLGVPKDSYITGLYAVGRALAQGRYDEDPTDPGNNIDLQYAAVQSGEPYDSKPNMDVVKQSFRNRGAYYADAYLQWTQINTLTNGFVDAYVLGRTAERPAAQAYSFQTHCPPVGGPATPVAGAWDSLSRGTASASWTGSTTTSSADPNPADGAATDPIANSGCMSEQVSNEDPGQAFWSWQIPSGGLTLLGLPAVELGYALAGVDATVVYKLWDVAPDGTKTLVSRGDQRIATEAGDLASGTLGTEL